MPKQNQAAEAKSDKKSRPRVEPVVVHEPDGDLTWLAELPGGPSAAAGVGTVQAQAARLSDRRLLGAQRRTLATQIRRMQGNKHLQRVIASMKPEEITEYPKGKLEYCMRSANKYWKMVREIHKGLYSELLQFVLYNHDVRYTRFMRIQMIKECKGTDLMVVEEARLSFLKSVGSNLIQELGKEPEKGIALLNKILIMFYPAFEKEPILKEFLVRAEDILLPEYAAGEAKKLRKRGIRVSKEQLIEMGNINIRYLIHPYTNEFKAGVTQGAEQWKRSFPKAEELEDWDWERIVSKAGDIAGVVGSLLSALAAIGIGCPFLAIPFIVGGIIVSLTTLILGSSDEDREKEEALDFLKQAIYQKTMVGANAICEQIESRVDLVVITLATQALKDEKYRKRMYPKHPVKGPLDRFVWEHLFGDYPEDRSDLADKVAELMRNELNKKITG